MSEILVTGGRGLLGRRVVEGLRAADRGVRVLSRSGRPGTIQGDMLTGEGLERAMDGIGTIVHCASSPLRKTHQTDVDGTERLLRVAARAGVSHIVYISIFGVDRAPYYPYYRVKLETERVVEGSPVPWTILRATQFHDFLLRILRLLERLPIILVPKGFLLQPVDVGEVAGRLVELALSAPAGRVPDMGGPEVRTMMELADTYFRKVGRQRRILEVPLPGKTARAFREGAHVCLDECAYGKIRWEDFLCETLVPET